jgi:replication factor A1
MSLEKIVDTRTPICDINPRIKFVSVKFKVVSLSKARQVKSKRTGKLLLVAEAIIADDTGKITLTLWNDDVDFLIEGRCYELKFGKLEMYDKAMRLSRAFSGKFTPIPDCFENINLELNMSKPFVWMTPRKRTHRSKEGRTFQGIPGRDQRGYCSNKEF